jgi:hypothetical protein
MFGSSEKTLSKLLWLCHNSEIGIATTKGAPIKNKKSETRRNGVKSDPTNYRIKDFFLIDKNLKKIKTSQELL